MDTTRNAGITKSRSGHYTVWVRSANVFHNFRKLEKHHAQRILGEVKEALKLSGKDAQKAAIAAIRA